MEVEEVEEAEDEVRLGEARLQTIRIGAKLKAKMKQNLIVVVKKKIGKPLVCINFTKLNKAYPKNSFLLLMIDTLVNAKPGNEMMSFLNAYSLYKQILMHLDNQENTSFMIERWIYCYKVMPFVVKNVRATYKLLVNKMFN